MPVSSREIARLIGLRVRAARLAANASQTALGAELGVSFQQVQKYESGANRVPSPMLFKIARYLNKPVSFFFPDPDDASLDEELDFVAHLAGMKNVSLNASLKILDALDKLENPVRENLVSTLIAISDD